MEENHLITLQDEDGNDVSFEHLMTIEHEGNYYIILEATADDDDCQEGEAIILKIVRDEATGEDTYVTLNNEEELNAVFDKCIAAMEEEDEENDVDGLEDLLMVDGEEEADEEE